jgi:hypothetical protein
VPSEKKIEQAACRYAKSRGALVYKFSSPAHRGVPDRLFIKNGRVLFLEFKAPGKKPTKLQQRELDLLQGQKVVAFYVDSLTGAVDAINDILK